MKQENGSNAPVFISLKTLDSQHFICYSCL